MVAKYCEKKDIWLPTNEIIHQELGGVLFSIREANNPTPKVLRQGAAAMRREPKINHFHTYRGGSVGRKPGPPPVAIRPGFSSFKVPVVLPGSTAAAMDLSDRETKSTKSSP